MNVVGCQNPGEVRELLAELPSSAAELAPSFVGAPAKEDVKD